MTCYYRIGLAACAVLMVEGCSTAGDRSNHDARTASGLAGDTVQPDTAPTQSELLRLAAWMTGVFSNRNQAQADSRYYEITLAMKRVWSARSDDGYWIYVEQAMAGAPPYRQRVYFVEQRAENSYVSRVYEFADEALEVQVVGAWQDEDPLANLDPQAIVAKDGCEVHLTWDGEAFSGATMPRACPSSLNGAAYATSEVTVTDTQLASWDRGYDATDAQVWGATAGAYLFDKIQDLDSDLAP